MALTENVIKDLTEAMKSQDKFALSVLRMLKSALQMEKINLKHELTDEEATIVIKRQVKQRKDSIIEYENYNKLLNIPKILKCAEIIDKLPEYELVTQQINEYKANNQVDECIKYLTEISSQINEGYSNFTAEKLSSTYNTYVINYEKLFRSQSLY